MSKNIRALIIPYLRTKMLLFIVLFFFTIIFGILSIIFSLPGELLSYTLLLTLTAAFSGLCIEFILFYKKVQKIEAVCDAIPHNADGLPENPQGAEQSYDSCIKKFSSCYGSIAAEYEKKKTEIEDYFTLWTHQIKTPLTALKAHMQCAQAEGKEIDAVLTRELLKIEQYADMALQYIRLNSVQTDFVFSKVDISSLVKQSVKKFAPLFIASKNAVHIDEFSVKVLSDEKWLSFVIDQILSNAVKYTKNGKISVYMDALKKDVLVIEDTGIGILPEDIQRLGEKGFTGCNGRLDKKASGLGLYLCKSILSMLGHSLYFASQSGRGTRVFIDLHKNS